MDESKGTPTSDGPLEGPILVAVDFSDYSRAALTWAVDQAISLGVPLLVLHVVHDPEGGPGYYKRPKRRGFLRRMEDAAADMMREFMRDFAREHGRIATVVGIDTKLVVGIPATRILEVAAKTDARMIVMGSQGRTGLAHFMLGSKAQRVVQLATIPVTVVKTPA